MATTAAAASAATTATSAATTATAAFTTVTSLSSTPTHHVLDTSPFNLSLSFGVADYAMFIAMMLSSALIGVYYGCYKKQNTVSDYLHGGHSMGVFPTALSLVASSVSGITMLGVPSEIYVYGTQFFAIALTIFPSVVIVMYWFVPMFYKLQYTSSFEYLEHRFSRRVRQLASFLYALGNLLYLPVVIYVPCLALNQVSGINVHIISPIACIVCIFYTSVGGLKAVVWTDALQLLLLALASLVVIVLGVMRVGGVGSVWEKAVEGGRLELFNMDPSPFARCTFWNVGLGTVFMHLAYHGTSPSSVQRYLSVSSLSKARKTLAMLGVGYFITKALSVATGLIIFASYFYCDPLHRSVGVVKKQDQLVPYYVMDVAQSWPGLSGLFVSGVFSAALSTMSACLNTLSATLYKDFIEQLLPMKVSDERASTHMKLLSVVIGVISVIMIFVVENLGGVLTVAISLAGVTSGAAFGLFVMGMFIPWVNHKGALAGALGSLAFMALTVGGNSYAQATKKLHYPGMPTRTDGCRLNSTVEGLISTVTAFQAATSTAVPLIPVAADADVFPLFKVSNFYFGLIGTAVTIIVGVAVSWCTGFERLSELDPDLFSPAVSRFLPRFKKQQQQEEERQQLRATPLQEYKIVPSSENNRVSESKEDDRR